MKISKLLLITSLILLEVNPVSGWGRWERRAEVPEPKTGSSAERKASTEYKSKAEFDINEQDEKGDTALIRAAREKKAEKIRELINEKADLKIKNNDDQYFYNYLWDEKFLSENPDIAEIVRKEAAENIAKILLEKGLQGPFRD